MKDIVPSSPVPSLWPLPTVGFHQDLQYQPCFWGGDLRSNQEVTGHPHNFHATMAPGSTPCPAGHYCSLQSTALVGDFSPHSGLCSSFWPCNRQRASPLNQHQLMPTASVTLSSPAMRFGDCRVQHQATLYLKKGATIPSGKQLLLVSCVSA